MKTRSQIGKASRDKGKRFERQIANKLKEYGFEAHRGQQFCGRNGDADVVGLPNVHIECKAVESLNLYGAMEQSISDARENEVPIVIHKKNNKPILVTMLFDDYMAMYIGGMK